ncbi:UNVERIFIED_CONTAM: hypothetical protein Slati_2146300 [Sesamum latifolium]|uniref:Pr1-like protein n=1 Tax=Sesamum latifolium TaxID=2727402 RepID=A0AAW2WWB3_9LAMI
MERERDGGSEERGAVVGTGEAGEMEQGRPTSEGGDGPPGEAIGGGARRWRDREGAVNRRARGRERGGGGGKGER